MKKYLIMSLGLFIFYNLTGQTNNIIYNKVNDLKENHNIFEDIESFKLLKQDTGNVYYFEFNTNKIIENNYNQITINIPLSKENIVIDLYQTSRDFKSYSIVTDKNEKISSKNKNKHYRGIIRNNPNSLVAFSFFENNIMGLISDGTKTYSIGRDVISSSVILSEDNISNINIEMFCGIDGEGINKFTNYSTEQIQFQYTTRNLSNTVKIYIETEYDMYTTLGNSISNVENFVTGLYNQVGTLYENEGINIIISTINIWTTGDPYNAQQLGSTCQLEVFQNNMNPSLYNGNLGQLLSFHSLMGGAAAGFNGLCNSNYKESLSVAGLHNFYDNVPSYSWSVYVATHEIGHLLGSRHTHACVWNDLNTAIDGCGSCMEPSILPSPHPDCQQSNITCNNCIRPAIPLEGGTIMSYCHLFIQGINFSLGFGEQPGNVIRYNVYNAECLCEENIVITENVHSGFNDIQSAEISITATNTIEEDAYASYDAGETIFLNPGFHAESGSEFNAFILGCGDNGLRSIDEFNNNEYESFELMESNTTTSNLKVYPNPTETILIVNSIEKMMHIQIKDFSGFNKENVKLARDEKNQVSLDLSSFLPGFYFLVVSFENGMEEIKTIYKK